MDTFLAQLYAYNIESYTLIKGTVGELAGKFTTEKEDGGQNYWLNFHEVADQDAIIEMGKQLKIDSYAIEDIFEEKKRAKLEEFNNYVFFTIKSALPTKTKDLYLQMEQISFILGKGFLISFQQKPGDHFSEVRERIEKNKGLIRKKSCDFLLFRMLEAVIDNYFETVDEIEMQIQLLEKLILIHSKSTYLNIVELEKRKLLELRKIVSPMKDLVAQLEKTQSNILIEENKYYFNDLRDSCATVLDEIDANKQILEGLTNIYYSVQGQKMNEIMKVLTVISSIFIPITFIAGIYGMNWDNQPELHHPYGYFICLGVMFLVAVGMIMYFAKKGWLSKSR